MRRVSPGVYEVRFAGTGSLSAVASAANALSWVQTLPGGVFRVGLHVPGRDDRAEVPFVLVAV